MPGRFLVLGALVVVAFVLRVWALERVPPGLDSDEVSIGYNAYSVLRTGRDEYGAPWPLAFRAYGEWKRPAYIYAAVPSIAVFGPTSFGVRFPAAVAGAAAVAALYAVAVLLLGDRRMGLGAAGLLAVSPWHLQFTRAAREASLLVLAILLLTAALLAAFRASRGDLTGLPPAPPSLKGRGCGQAAFGGLRRERLAGLCYVGAALAFLLALYSYPGAVIFTPLLVLVLAHAYWPSVLAAPRRWLAAAVVIAAIGALPLAQQWLDGRARVRVGAVSLLANEELVTLAGTRMRRDLSEGAPWVLQHPWLVSARAAADAYLAHFNPTYLFTRGDPEWRHHASDTGQLYLWEAPLLLAGLAALLRGWRQPALQVIGGWLAIGPLPAAFTTETPHAVRSIGMLPAWYLLAAAGARPIWGWLQRRGYGRDWLLLLALSVGFYLFMFYDHYPIEHAESWWSGHLEVFQEAKGYVDAGRYDRVVIVQHTGINHLYALYATRYDPATYLAQGGSGFGADEPLRFAPFERRVVDWQSEPRAPNVLYVLGGTTVPPGAQVVKRVKSVSGFDAAMLVAFPEGRG